MFWLLSWLLYTSFFIVLPLYASLQAATASQADSATLLRWLVYWIAVNATAIPDALFGGLIYGALRCLALLALMIPSVSARIRLTGLQKLAQQLAALGLADAASAQLAQLSERLHAVPLYARYLEPAVLTLGDLLAGESPAEAADHGIPEAAIEFIEEKIVDSMNEELDELSAMASAAGTVASTAAAIAAHEFRTGAQEASAQ